MHPNFRGRIGKYAGMAIRVGNVEKLQGSHRSFREPISEKPKWKCEDKQWETLTNNVSSYSGCPENDS